ncbi:hypothetical protein [Canicola haemoglobinophilus]|nr:hypothetical protein [Canicola haemoglobinophilus]
MMTLILSKITPHFSCVCHNLGSKCGLNLLINATNYSNIRQ